MKLDDIIKTQSDIIHDNHGIENNIIEEVEETTETEEVKEESSQEVTE